MKVDQFRFGTQNITEGLLPHAMSSCDAGVLQEVDKEKLERQMRLEHMRVFVPVRDPHQALFWNPRWIDITSTGWTEFHRSGTAEKWPFKSPQRGLIWGRGRLVENPKIKVALFGLWFLNSWDPMNPDHHTHLRNQIVRKTSIPIVQNKIIGWRDNGYLVIGGGDANSIKWPGQLALGLKQPWENGLDRIWYDNKLDLVAKREGPQTGVGPDMRHESRIVTLKAA